MQVIADKMNIRKMEASGKLECVEPLPGCVAFCAFSGGTARSGLNHRLGLWQASGLRKAIWAKWNFAGFKKRSQIEFGNEKKE
jgi:hypothetical protein